MWGHARVASVSVTRIRYRGGDPRTLPIREPLEPMSPWSLTDPRQLLEQYPDGGRFQLLPLDNHSKLAADARFYDLRDGAGRLNLTAPLGSDDAPAAAPAAPAAGSDFIALFRELASRAEASRSNDFAAFVQLMGASKGDGGSTVLQSELTMARARVGELEGKLEATRAELIDLRLRLARKPEPQAGGESDFTSALLLAGAERLGLLPGLGGALRGRPAGGVAPAAAPAAEPAAEPAAAPDLIGLPSADEFRAVVRATSGGDGIPRELIARMARLRSAGALPDDLWAVAGPIAEHLGLAVGGP